MAVREARISRNGPLLPGEGALLDRAVLITRGLFAEVCPRALWRIPLPRVAADLLSDVAGGEERP